MIKVTKLMRTCSQQVQLFFCINGQHYAVPLNTVCTIFLKNDFSYIRVFIANVDEN